MTIIKLKQTSKPSYLSSYSAVFLALLALCLALPQSNSAHSIANEDNERTKVWQELVDKGEAQMRLKQYDDAEQTLELSLREIEDTRQNQSLFLTTSQLLADCYRNHANSLRASLCASFGFPNRIDLDPFLPWAFFLLALVVLFLPDAWLDPTPTAMRHSNDMNQLSNTLFNTYSKEMATDEAIAAELGRTLPSPIPKFVVLVVLLGLSAYGFYITCIAQRKDDAAAKIELTNSLREHANRSGIRQAPQRRHNHSLLPEYRR